MARPIQAPAPNVPPEFQKADCTALIALAAGSANEFQQRRILDLIVNRLAETYGLSYRPGDDRATCFAEGKRFVGLQIVKLLNSNPDKFKDE